jgi:hypothetical protein
LAIDPPEAEAGMRSFLLLLVAANLAALAWIVWGDPLEGAHEPLRISRQIEPGALRPLGEAELQAARTRSQETLAAEAQAQAQAAARASEAASSKPATEKNHHK